MSGGDAPARRSRGATFAGFTEKIREKISASPQPLVLGDPTVRSELAKEHQPEKVELDKGEFFDNVSQGKQVVQLKMNKAGISVVDPTTKVRGPREQQKKILFFFFFFFSRALLQAVVGETFQWQYIADFRVGKNKKTFAIMHDAKKDGSKLERVEWKSADTMRMLGTATKFVDVLAAEMREKAQKDAEAAARAAEAPAPKKKKADKKAAKKSGLGQHSHSPRGDGADDNKDAADNDDAADNKDDADADADAAEKKPRRKRGNTKKKSDADAAPADDDGESKKADSDKNDDDDDDKNENDANAAPAAESSGEAKPRRARRGTKSKGTAGADGAEAAEPLIEKKKKARSRAQTTMN